MTASILLAVTFDIFSAVFPLFVIVDLCIDSPRVYTSTNPWKTSSVLEAICSSKVEYESIVAFLRAESPPDPGPGKKRPKSELAHLALIDALEARAAKVDAELAVSLQPIQCIFVVLKTIQI